MCLKPIHSALKTAEKDIIVYKRLIQKKDLSTKKIILISPYKGFIYKLNTLYKVKTKLGGNKSKRYVHTGLHAYQSLKSAKFLASSRESVYQGIIPKGSIYKMGYCDIVSNNLIIKKCKIKKK